LVEQVKKGNQYQQITKVITMQSGAGERWRHFDRGAVRGRRPDKDSPLRH
jgi:hypothetical protein